jgi:hypothetical protein
MRWSLGDILMFIFMSIMTVIVVLYVLFNIGLYMGVMNAQRLHGADAVSDVPTQSVQVVDHDFGSCPGQAHRDYAGKD